MSHEICKKEKYQERKAAEDRILEIAHIQRRRENFPVKQLEKEQQEGCTAM